MQYKDRVAELGNVHDAEDSVFISDSDFTDTGTDAIHWLPIVRFITSLNHIELVAGSPSCNFRKATKRVERISPEHNGFQLAHTSLFIQNFVYEVNSTGLSIENNEPFKKGVALFVNLGVVLSQAMSDLITVDLTAASSPEEALLVFRPALIKIHEVLESLPLTFK